MCKYVESLSALLSIWMCKYVESLLVKLTHYRISSDRGVFQTFNYNKTKSQETL